MFNQVDYEKLCSLNLMVIALLSSESKVVPFFYEENVTKSQRLAAGPDFRSRLLDQAVRGKLSPEDKEDIKCVIILSESGQELPSTLFMLQGIGQMTKNKRVAVGGRFFWQVIISTKPLL